MILAHHGYGEETIIYALAGGGGAAYALAFAWRARIGRLVRWLRRK
jgi:hypothetical protein